MDDRVRRRAFGPEVELDIWDIAASTGEVLVGLEPPDGHEIRMEYVEPGDVSEHLANVSTGQTVYYGVLPYIDDDGFASVSFTPPDADGVVRPQPI
jgi:hypothetical protein